MRLSTGTIFGCFCAFGIAILSIAVTFPAFTAEGTGKIPIHVEEPSGMERKAEPVQVGVPFAPGTLKDATIRLFNSEGTEVPAFARVSVRWSRDNSVKWLLLDFQADIAAKQKITYTLEYGPELKPKAPANPITIEDTAERISASTQATTAAGKAEILKFSVSKKGGGRLESAQLGERVFVEATNKHDLTWDYQSIPPARTRSHWRGSWKIPEGEGAESVRSTAAAGFLPDYQYEDSISQFKHEYVQPGKYSLVVEEQNPFRVVVRANGWYAGPGRDKTQTTPNCFYVVRYIAFAGKPYIRMEHSFVMSVLPEDAVNRVDPKYYSKYGIPKQTIPEGSRMKAMPDKVYLRRMGFTLPIRESKRIVFGGGAEKGTEAPGPLGKIAGTDNPGDKLHALDITPETKSAYLLSVGPKIHHNGVTPLKAKKEKEETYDVVVEKEGSEDESIGDGARSRGFVTVQGKSGSLSICIGNFYRQHPNELQVDPKNGMIWAWLWADHGGMVLDNWNPKYGRKIGHPNDTTLGGQANGWSKTHHCLLLFDERPADEAVKEAEKAERLLNAPLWPYVDPEYGCPTGAAGNLSAVDAKNYPGMENQLRISAAMFRLHQEILHWNGFFDYGDHPYEYNQHGVRRSRGPRGTYCWTDYAGWALNDGNVAHHWWMMWFRTGDRLYRELAENLSRRINDETTSHWQCPDVIHDVQHAKGGGHRHDQSGFHGISTHYGSDWLGTFDCYTMTGYRRAHDWIRNDMYRWRRRGIWGLSGSAGCLALAHEMFPTQENKFVEGAEIKSETDERGVIQVMRWNRSYGLMRKAKPGPEGWEARDKEPLTAKKKYGFRAASQLLMPMEYQFQVCDGHPDKEMAEWGVRTKNDMLAMADSMVATHDMNHHPARMFAWAYLHSGDNKYLQKLFTAIRSKVFNRQLKAAAAYSGNPLEEGWGITSIGGKTLPGGNVKQHWILWNASCWPEAIQALKKAGVTEAEVLDGTAEQKLNK